ncbi:MAG: transposase [Nitrososphaeraceae archaeon]
MVRRGEVVLDFDVIDNWNNELDNMNNGKEGASYVYPDSFFQLLGCTRAYFHPPYRHREGVARAHAKSKVPSIPEYSTIQRRINKHDIKIDEHLGNDIVIALDSTRVTTTNREKCLSHNGR